MHWGSNRRPLHCPDLLCAYRSRNVKRLRSSFAPASHLDLKSAIRAPGSNDTIPLTILLVAGLRPQCGYCQGFLTGKLDPGVTFDSTSDLRAALAVRASALIVVAIPECSMFSSIFNTDEHH